MSKYHEISCFTDALKEMKDAIRNERVKEPLKESKKAVVPSLMVVETLEKGATTSTFCQKHLCGGHAYCWAREAVLVMTSMSSWQRWLSMGIPSKLGLGKPRP